MSSSSQSSRQVRIEIAVQPPVIVGVGRWLIPPVVARTSDAELLEMAMNGSGSIYATLMLTSTNGEDYSASLGGNWNANAQVVANSSSSSGGSSSRRSRNYSLYFIFNQVSIGVTGTFTITVVVSVISPTTGYSEVVGGRATRQITVVDDPVRPERPGSSERQVLRQLEAAGYYRP